MLVSIKSASWSFDIIEWRHYYRTGGGLRGPETSIIMKICGSTTVWLTLEQIQLVAILP